MFKKYSVMLLALLVLCLVVSGCVDTTKPYGGTQSQSSIYSTSSKVSSEPETSSSEETVSVKSDASTTASQTESSEIEATSSKTETTSSIGEEPSSKGVYITPTGKRYHFDPDCGGKNSYLSDIKTATSKGLTPCKKCANG